MKAFKRKMVKSLVEYTGRPELFKKIKWVDINPLLATSLHIGWSEEEIAAKDIDGTHFNDSVAGNYSYLEDIIFIKTPTETVANNLCLHPEVYTQTLNIILHEVAHRLQYLNGYKHISGISSHKIEFQVACLELGLVPSIEAYDVDEYIEHNPNQTDFYDWAGKEGVKYTLQAVDKTIK